MERTETNRKQNIYIKHRTFFKQIKYNKIQYERNSIDYEVIVGMLR